MGKSRAMKFTKMQAIGNDFLILDAIEDPGLAAPTRELVRSMCDRRTGAAGGADGVLVVGRRCGDGDSAAGGNASSSGRAGRITMRVINADGSDGGLSGNGGRCAALYAAARGYVVGGLGPDGRGEIEVDAGVRVLRARVESMTRGKEGRIRGVVSMNMGPPEFALARVPVDAAMLRPAVDAAGATRANVFVIEGREASFVSMGNPHMVCFVGGRSGRAGDAELRRLALEEGPRFERHAAFPQRMNVHYAAVDSPRRVRLFTFERGAGLTLGSGTGASATVVCGARLELLERKAEVVMAGGVLMVKWSAEGNGDVVIGGEVEQV